MSDGKACQSPKANRPHQPAERPPNDGKQGTNTLEEDMRERLEPIGHLPGNPCGGGRKR